MSSPNWMVWASPILASLTAILAAGTVAHLFNGEVLALIAAIVTAVDGFIVAIQARPGEGEAAQVQKLQQQQPKK
jgi:hypothetical protein